MAKVCGEVVGDAGVGLGMAGVGDEVVVGPEADAADDDDVAELCAWVAGKMDAGRSRWCSRGCGRRSCAR